jgi:3-phosphoshikimate 1-carboxyvinyltransferase
MLVEGLSDCDDVRSSLAVFGALGGRAVPAGNGDLLITGLGGEWDPPDNLLLPCDNSGTTMRLLTGILAGKPGRYVLDGDAQLRRRPMERVAVPLRKMGARITTTDGRPPVTVEGAPLTGVSVRMSHASAQLKSAILLAGLSAEGETVVAEPAPSRDHTERMIAHFRGDVETSGLTVAVRPSKLILSDRFRVPADPSSAAFFLTAAAFLPGSRVTAESVLVSETRTGFLRVLGRMGARVEISGRGDRPMAEASFRHGEPMGDVTVGFDGVLSGTEIPAGEIASLIDEIPVLALAATQARGRTVFHNVGELRVKETDRLGSIVAQLGALGADAAAQNDDLVINGPTRLSVPEGLDSGADHRLAMTLSLALKTAGGRAPIAGRESISVSYPNFDEHLESLWRD